MPMNVSRLYLGGAFAQFSPDDVLKRQQEFIDWLAPSEIDVLRPKHQGAYPRELGKETEAVLTMRDRRLFRQSDLIVLDFLDATELSRGSILEMGWANAWDIPLLLIAEPFNKHLFNMSKTLATYIVDDRRQAAEIAKSLLT